MDEGGIFTADQNLSNGRSGRQHSISRYREFIRSFRNSFDNTFIYRDQLRRNVGCAAASAPRLSSSVRRAASLGIATLARSRSVHGLLT